MAKSGLLSNSHPPNVSTAMNVVGVKGLLICICNVFFSSLQVSCTKLFSFSMIVHGTVGHRCI